MSEVIRKAAKKWFYQSFDDDLLEKMQKHGLIAQAEGFSISVMAELEVEMEEAFRSELAALREELAILKHPMNSAAMLRKELASTEQLNAELFGLLEELLDPTKFVPRERIRAALAQPTESGASE